MLRPDVRLEWFVSFLAVVDTGSFVAAAEATNRSQPRVSMHVSSLERAAGVQILDRRRRPVALTEAGEALARHARLLLHELEAAEEAMATWRGGGRGIVHLGAYPSVSAAFAPALILRMAETAPDIRVSLTERSTLELDDALKVGDVDLYLRPVSPAPARSTVRMLPLWREDIVAVVPDGHPLSSRPEPIDVAEVAEYPLISIGQLGAREFASYEAYELFDSMGYELDLVQATNEPQTLVAMVRAGLGLGVTNRLAACTTDTTGVTVRRMTGGHERVVAVCWDEDKPLSPAAVTLLEQVRATPAPPDTMSVSAPERAGTSVSADSPLTAPSPR